MRESHVKSDIDITLRPDGFPDGFRDLASIDFTFTLTSGAPRPYAAKLVVTQRDGVLSGAVLNPDGSLRIAAPNPGLTVGELWVEITAQLPDDGHADGYRKVVWSAPTGVSLVAVGPDTTALTGNEVSIALPIFRGEKGDRGEDGYTPIKGVDYWTAEDVAEVNAATVAATEAAAVANAAAEAVTSEVSVTFCGDDGSEDNVQLLKAGVAPAAGKRKGKAYVSPYICNGVMPANAVPGNVYANYGVLKVSRNKDGVGRAKKSVLFNFIGGNAFDYRAEELREYCVLFSQTSDEIYNTPWKIYHKIERSGFQKPNVEYDGDDVVFRDIPDLYCVLVYSVLDGDIAKNYRNGTVRFVTMSKYGYVEPADSEAERMSKRYLPPPTKDDIVIRNVKRRGDPNQWRCKICQYSIARGRRLVVQVRRYGDGRRHPHGVRGNAKFRRYVNSAYTSIKLKKVGATLMRHPFRARWQGRGACSEWREFIASSYPPSRNIVIEDNEGI